MKKYISSLTLAVIFSISISVAQETDKIIKDSKTGNDILYGAVSREGLINLGNWFAEEYEIYQPNLAIIDSLKLHKEKFPYVFIVLGTWCGDSKEHVPHFFKIADLLDYPKNKIFMVSVDREKNGGEFCLADFNITLVPTFIFTVKGDEIGRIIETPSTSLEQDMLGIILNQYIKGL